jgi:hypothetical protein
MTYRGNGSFVLALAVTLIAGGTAEADPLTINGEVATPLTLNDNALGGTSVSATIGGVQYSGSSVYSLITDAGFQNNPAQAKNGNLLDYLSITGATGQSVVLSEGQIDPSFGGQTGNPQDFIATSANGSPIAPRLIVQSDPNGTTDGYDITGVKSITVGWATVPAFSTSVLNNESSFTVTGHIASSPASYSTSNFSSTFPSQTTQTDSYYAGATPTTKTFTGVPIFTLLQNAGLLTDPSNPQSILDDYIVVTGSNEPTNTSPLDYTVLYSLGEIDPAYNDFTSATEPLLAEVSGTTFRTTAPSDKLGGRYDSDVVNINVVDTVPEPVSLALMLPPLILLFAFSRRWRGCQA